MPYTTQARDEYAELLGDLMVFGEQLKHWSKLLQEGGVAKGRMALVGVDHLAEVVLFRHLEHVLLDREDGPLGYRLPRLSAMERRRIRDSFGRKVELATQPIETWLSISRFQPVLDARDAAIFRVGHAYRNSVYHGDRHNPAFLIPVGKVYWHAFGRAWTKLQPETRWWHSELLTRLPRLETLGYTRPAEDRGPMFNNRVAARAIVSHLGTALAVTTGELSRLATEDLAVRTATARDELNRLLRDGIGEERLLGALWWTQFWEHASTDGVLIGLESEQDVSYREMIDVPEISEERRNAFNAARAAYDERLEELARGFKPTVTIALLDELDRLGPRLHTARSEAHLLTRYQALDERLRILEDVIDRVGDDWERHVQLQIDIARGK